MEGTRWFEPTATNSALARTCLSSLREHTRRANLRRGTGATGSSHSLDSSSEDEDEEEDEDEDEDEEDEVKTSSGSSAAGAGVAAGWASATPADVALLRKARRKRIPKG